jgi:hypothetical protein
MISCLLFIDFLKLIYPNINSIMAVSRFSFFFFFVDGIDEEDHIIEEDCR